MFRPGSMYVSTELKVCINWLDVCFDHTRGMFRLSLKVSFYRARVIFRPCTNFGSTVARGIFRPCSKYVSIVHESCFDRRSRYSWPWSRFVSSVLEVVCDHARFVFQPCVRFFSTVAPGMFRPSLEVCFDRARVRFSTVLKVCFNRAWGLVQLTCRMFWPCTRYISTVSQSMFLQ